MTYFQDTYAFIDGHRLQTILKYIDEWSMDSIEQGNSCNDTTREQQEGDGNARVNKRRKKSNFFLR